MGDVTYGACCIDDFSVRAVWRADCRPAPPPRPPRPPPCFLSRASSVTCVPPTECASGHSPQQSVPHHAVEAYERGHELATTAGPVFFAARATHSCRLRPWARTSWCTTGTAASSLLATPTSRYARVPGAWVNSQGSWG